MKKTLCRDAAQEQRAFIGIAFYENRPVGFGVFEEATPEFAKFRSFVTRIFYHQSGNTDISVGLMKFFETWARVQGIKYHLFSTRRPSGSAIRLFTGPKYGFKVSSTTFEKEL